MFSRHSRDFHTRDFLCLLLQKYRIFGSWFYINHHALEGVELIDRCEGLIFTGFVGQVRFCMWGCDDGEGAAERGLDFAVEVVSGVC